MRKRACFAGVVAASAGLMMAGTPAIADSADNDGVNIGNDNNVSVLPVQACGNNVAVLGAVVPLLSPQSNDCVNAPIVDHPTEKPDKPEKPEHPHKPHHPHPGGEGPCWEECDEGGGGEAPAPGPAPAPAPEAPTQVSPAELPAAPSPVAVAGHHAVTG